MFDTELYSEEDMVTMVVILSSGEMARQGVELKLDVTR